MRVGVWWLFVASAFAGADLSTLVSPCPAAPTKIAPPPITVTSQYQPVSTCTASSIACKRRRCKTEYAFSTYPFVSTVIPCPYGESGTVSTITKTEQIVVVSRTSSTSTEVRVTPIAFTRRGKSTTSTSTTTVFTTLVKEWTAPYKDLGPLAIPGYDGSGLCRECKGPKGEKLQVVEAIGCDGHGGSTTCSKWAETWIHRPIPTSASQAKAVCTSHVAVPTPGTFTFAFPQKATASIHVPQRIFTYKNGPKVVTTTIIETVTVVTKDWTAFVTRYCPRPTTIDFRVTVTTTVFFTVPPFIPPFPKFVNILLCRFDIGI